MRDFCWSSPASGGHVLFRSNFQAVLDEISEQHRNCGDPWAIQVRKGRKGESNSPQSEAMTVLKHVRTISADGVAFLHDNMASTISRLTPYFQSKEPQDKGDQADVFI
jgi:hypothetical protein